MDKTIRDYEQDNLLLLDMLFRQQYYLEGWKTGLANNYKLVLTHLYGEFMRYIHQTKYQTMDQFTKAQLTEFIRRFTNSLNKFYSSYTVELIATLQKFLSEDLDVTKDIYEKATGETIEQAQTSRPNDPNADASGMYGIKALSDPEQLWANILNSPVPASGLKFSKQFTDFGTSSAKSLTALIWKGYANAWTISEFSIALAGTDSNYHSVTQVKGRASKISGSLFSNWLNQQSALLYTTVQHIKEEISAAVGSAYFVKYQWVSVMDSHTTVICWNRNGNVYIIGEGPIPPAHYFCRSKIVFLSHPDSKHDIPESFLEWMQRQPETFLIDVLGKDQAAKLAEGDLTEVDLQNISIAPLTLTELIGKLKIILGDK